MKRLKYLVLWVSVIYAAPCIIRVKAADDAVPLTSQTKSVLFPGWGQISEGHTLKGLTFMTCELVSIGLAIHYGMEGSDYYDRYRRTDDPNDAERFRNLTVLNDKRRNAAVLCGIAVWGLNLLDINLGKPKPASFSVQSTGRAFRLDSFSALPHPSGIFFSLSFSLEI